jgi:hypothetical protein
MGKGSATNKMKRRRRQVKKKQRHAKNAGKK